MHSDDTIEAMAAIFKALGDPTRLRMLLTLLAEGEQPVNVLAEKVDLSVSAVSHQLRLLRHLRIVQAERQGRSVIYALDDEHICGLLRQALEHQQH